MFDGVSGAVADAKLAVQAIDDELLGAEAGGFEEVDDAISMIRGVISMLIDGLDEIDEIAS